MATVPPTTEESLPPWLCGIEGSVARALIVSDHPVIRVIAGPGSGKTTCLKRRTQRLVQQRRIDPATIFAGTFTRAIAQELKETLGDEIKVSTLHSLAYELLRRNPVACQGMCLRFLLRYEEDCLLYDIDEAGSAIGNIHKRREALRLLQASRAQRKIYSNAKFDGAVRQWLLRHQAMLIGEVVHLCVTGLESRDIAPAIFDHVVIDEYQDLTAAEQELVRLIWSEYGSLTVLGDNDQSIYGFRFNHPEGIADFHLACPNCMNLTFSDNRRSSDEILQVANLMMAEAGSAKPPMNSTRGSTGSLLPVQWEDLEAEIEGLAKYIRARVDESFLVLVPRRFIGYRLAEAIGSDASTAFAEEVLDHAIAQEAFATVSLLADPDDHVAVRAYLGFHGAKPQQANQRNARAYSSSPDRIGGHALVRAIANGEVTVSGRGQGNIRNRAINAVELIDRNQSPEEIVDEFFDDALASSESDEEKSRWLAQDLEELRDAARELLALGEEVRLSDVVSELRYRIATRAPLRMSDTKETRVRIMTLHAAKGLEAKNVVIAGVADQLMPGMARGIVDEVAEQRRLLYVAVTRARDNLIISWPRKIQLADILGNGGRRDQMITQGGVRWAVASRSRLLPQGLNGVMTGNQLLDSLRARN